MEVGVFELSLGFVALSLLFYYYCTSSFSYWSSRGIAGPKPLPLFGNMVDILFNKVYLGDYFHELYQQFKNEPMFGVFSLRTPMLIVKDPDLIKDVLIKDFSSFSDRGIINVNEKAEPLAQHLFNLETARWKPLRTRLSPVFTSGKLKEMYYLLMECAEHFEEFLDERIKKDPIIDCRDITAKFTTDVIGVCAFGLQTNALADEDSEFRKIGRKVFEPTLVRKITNAIAQFAPWLFNILGSIMQERELNDFFINIVTQTMDYRKRNNITKNDFIDLLMEIRDDPSKVGNIEMTDALLTAQVFVFFLAGFETSSSTISNALYELAFNQSIQNKLRNEINEELQKTEGKLTYESIKNMKYMHKVFSETLRKFPPAAIIFRQSIKPYTFNDPTKLTIPKGMKVWIPAYSLQRDPAAYPDPDKFDPERFNEEAIQNRNPSYYLPFGDGPRNCIGARFANYQVKVGLVKILQNFRIDPCEKTCTTYVNKPGGFLLQPVGGIILKFTKITNSSKYNLLS